MVAVWSVRLEGAQSAHEASEAGEIQLTKRIYEFRITVSGLLGIAGSEVH